MIALALRLGTVMATPGYVPVTDPADYERIGLGWQETGAYPGRPGGLPGPSAYRPPLYPAFLAGAFATTPGDMDHRAWARSLQALLGTVAAFLVGLLAWQLTRRRRLALGAMGLAAVWPPMWFYGAAFLSETLVVPLILGAMVTALAWRESRRRRWLVAAGVLLGLATLTRINAIVLLAPLALVVWGPAGASWWRRAVPAAALAGVMAMTIAPWTVRNARVFDQFIPVATEDGYTLAGTYNDVARAQTRFPAAWVAWYEVPSNQRVIAGVPNTETAWNDALRESALEYATDHPGYVAKVGWWNLRRVFNAAGLEWMEFEYRGSGLTRTMAAIDLWTFWPVAILALLGLFTRMARSLPRWLWLVPAGFLLPVFLTGYLRFRAPINPLIVLLAVCGAMAVLERLRTRRSGHGFAPPRAG